MGGGGGVIFLNAFKTFGSIGLRFDCKNCKTLLMKTCFECNVGRLGEALSTSPFS